eukprot:gene18630-biopygen20464
MVNLGFPPASSAQCFFPASSCAAVTFIIPLFLVFVHVSVTSYRWWRALPTCASPFLPWHVPAAHSRHWRSTGNGAGATARRARWRERNAPRVSCVAIPLGALSPVRASVRRLLAAHGAGWTSVYRETQCPWAGFSFG